MEKKLIEQYMSDATIAINQWLDELRAQDEKTYEEELLKIWNQYCDDQMAEFLQWFDLRDNKERLEVISLMVKDPDQKLTPICMLQEKRYASCNPETGKITLCDSVDLRNLICGYMEGIIESIMVFPKAYHIGLYECVMWPILKGEGLVTSYEL